MGLVYFLNEEDATRAFRYLNFRYIDKYQINVKYAKKYFDISDFRIRIELKVNGLEPLKEGMLDYKHIQFLIQNAKKIGNNNSEKKANELEKIEFLKYKLRKFCSENGISVDAVLYYTSNHLPEITTTYNDINSTKLI